MSVAEFYSKKRKSSNLSTCIKIDLDAKKWGTREQKFEEINGKNDILKEQKDETILIIIIIIILDETWTMKAWGHDE